MREAIQNEIYKKNKRKIPKQPLKKEATWEKFKDQQNALAANKRGIRRVKKISNVLGRSER
ncbi:hypothetical protein [Secundilactobacillus kimchicus]|uniref:hypothetical protein n=1 Tax=Secundilactobacillus kimchicus TaxID=528209 RepID=UPI0006D1FB78|nr:hypothetical protein [Secundilactobacillus kimchicus]